MSFLSQLLPTIKLIISPKPFGIMDADNDVCNNNIRSLTQLLKSNRSASEIVQDEYDSDSLQVFYHVFELVEYFGTKRLIKELQLETYLFSLEFIAIFGIFHKYFLLNTQGTRIFYSHVIALDGQYFLYQELLPDLFANAEEICLLGNSNSDAMTVTMAVCQFISVISRIMLNNESQIIKENQIDHIKNSIEHALKCVIEFMEKIDPQPTNEMLKITISELIYRVELSSNILGDLKYFVKKLIPYIMPIQRNKQLGRSLLRTAIIGAELDLRKILIALRCYQFPMVVELCEMMLLRLEMNSFYTSDHAGAGAKCFNGFSVKFNESANQILLIFENLCLWSFCGAIEAAEMISKVLIKVYNLPAKHGWDGAWIGYNERTINMINSLGALKDSQTFCRLFSQ